ncbi:putative IQ motif, EF-hand binding protein [Helianthus annuus]|uniref:IQ motif, EF-hand binding protein n=1 Tax=Helianthus annuus TaxID=4232 RepID=A0A9K3J904_HELAN|nr:putative IQ motif, EF-hand binding protein [Helianthus annuus]KAJ0580919.1 putative IQ motif, EF-hand binding protein [Helianthus annuus]KAJ0588656.1 putative IQ motif, EF-hand binding protein [Helianthus annuus]KAJ0596860.1 putative IQ motif, EF-hand binding protein [Helianthus annuus]KAJ0757539.1 putative IQ motif, EF-hand binding protein [Helianthus annuus]
MAKRGFRGFMARRRFRLWSRLEKARGSLIVVKVNGEGLWWMVVQA